MSASGYELKLRAPLEAVAIVESALEGLGGALVLSNPDAAGEVALSLYLDAAPEAQDVTARLCAAAASAEIAVPAFELVPLPETDWVAESQKGLPTLSAGRFFLYGSHHKAPPPTNAISLLVDANAAFGTGRHESTKGCLLALNDLAKRRRFRQVLDMGCGSGVLAMAAARLWSCRVLAVDNDPVAVKVARANARANAVAGQMETACSEGYALGRVSDRGPYDLILANILAEPLNAMARDLTRHLAPGGIAVLSGLLTTQERMVLARHRTQGLCLERRLRLGDWSTLVLRCPG